MLTDALSASWKLSNEMEQMSKCLGHLYAVDDVKATTFRWIRHSHSSSKDQDQFFQYSCLSHPV